MSAMLYSSPAKWLAAGQVLVQRCVGFVREAAVAFDGDGVFVGGEDFEVDALADQRPTLAAWKMSHCVACQRARGSAGSRRPVFSAR